MSKIFNTVGMFCFVISGPILGAWITQLEEHAQSIVIIGIIFWAWANMYFLSSNDGN